MNTPFPDLNWLPLARQAALRNDWLRERLETLLPALMARAQLDMWLVIAQEYNEDPVIMTLLPEPEMAARRRTILLFHRRPDGSVERLTVSRYGQPGFYDAAWDPDEGDQWEALARHVRARDPQRIGINVSETSAFADGLSHGEYTRLATALGEAWMARVVSAESLAVAWLESRISAEWAVYPSLAALGHRLIATAFSPSVITPGVTTTADVVWWFREACRALGVAPWFQPSVVIQAHGQPFAPFYRDKPVRTLILPGDLLHCDFGFRHLGLCTDQQQHAYVLRPGERAAPDGLNQALANANRLQAIHLAAMRVGASGNDVLREALAAGRAAGLDGMIYSHPIGYHGHAAGPTIGLWDSQGGVPGRGDYPLYDETCYSIELNCVTPVPEWDDQPVRIMLEEEAFLRGGRADWLSGRQTALHLIG